MDTPTTNATSCAHEVGLSEVLADLEETEREAVAEHVRRLAELTKAKRDAVLMLTEG